MTHMQDADALWYDYETEETDSPVNGRRRWLRIFTLAVVTAATTYLGYATLIAG